jgi:DNA-binding NarL/FixJ family response regulator
MNRISVLLIDDDPLFGKLAARSLKGHDDITVVALADQIKNGLEQAYALQPDITLIDLASFDMRSRDILTRLRGAAPETGIIVLTIMDTEGYRETALAAGADELVSMSAIKTDLLPAIRRVAQTRLKKEET